MGKEFKGNWRKKGRRNKKMEKMKTICQFYTKIHKSSTQGLENINKMVMNLFKFFKTKFLKEIKVKSRYLT